ncbi:MAG: hypothetical protein RMK16_12225 [Acidobacteriota bacterium]|nr:hypothetical protein [Acidobacteriota bacterium]
MSQKDFLSHQAFEQLISQGRQLDRHGRLDGGLQTVDQLAGRLFSQGIL